jgi:hypothetical protein
MDAAVWAAIVGPITTLLGGLGGYWLAGRNDDARDQRAAARELAARGAALAERLEEQRHTFQRDMLLELQDELQKLARVTTQIILQDERTLKKLDQIYLSPPELSDEQFQIRISVERLRTRVLEAALRQGVGDFLDLCIGYGSASGLANEPNHEVLAELAGRRSQVASRHFELNELLGVHLRRELDRRYLARQPTQDAASPGAQT